RDPTGRKPHGCCVAGRNPATGPHHGYRYDITAPLEQLASLKITPQRILIVENLISLLTLPPMRDTVAVFGKGTAVSSLTHLPWIHTAQVYYWGDLDTHGFRILHSLRATGVQTSSLLMD